MGLTSQEVRELKETLDQLTDVVKVLPSSNASITVNAGAGAIGAAIFVASICIAALCVVASLYHSQGYRVDRLEQQQMMHEVRIRKNTEQIEVSNR